MSYMPRPANSFLSGAGNGAGMVVGAVVALAAIVAIGGAAFYLSQPVAEAPPKSSQVGTAAQARSTALNALKERGIASLAKETRATYDSVENQWVVFGPAETEDGRLTDVSVLLTVGTIRGKQHWKLTYMKIGAKEYIGE